LEALDALDLARSCREHEYGYRAVDVPKSPKERDTRLIGQHPIEHHQVGTLNGCPTNGGRSRLEDAVTCSLEMERDDIEQQLVVLDHQDRSCRGLGASG